ncbi:tetratricopeptide repeat protein [Halobacillus massiliensis]|uniref:tetratricopeptide repeat protein n=1 Tax=Halobacillus massiliensis TaxID=1926286 RepID=UPI0009E5AFBB|nr:tetratricopeptide repeat protein [Halobacillus massiliensis]
MDKQNGEVVLFPKWKSTLENVGFNAVKEKRYTEAVESFMTLLNHEVASHEVITALLMSLIELGQYEKAEDLCQEQMKIEEDHYYQYLHIYITILFQDNRYQELIDLLDEVFETEDIPHQNRTQLWQMYEVTKKLLADAHKEESDQLEMDFEKAIRENELHKQWAAISQLKKQPLPADLTLYKELLKKNEVHPIIKTEMILWFRDMEMAETVTIKKFGSEIEIVPEKLNSFQSDYIIQQIQLRLGAIEQENPTMYEMVQRLLRNYCYVRYPLYPTEHEVDIIVEALKQLGYEYLQLPYEKVSDDRRIHKYKEEIELCDQHYMILAGE